MVYAWKKNLDCHEMTLGRNMHVRSDSDKGSENKKKSWRAS